MATIIRLEFVVASACSASTKDIASFTDQNPILSIHLRSNGTGKPSPYPAATVIFRGLAAPTEYLRGIRPHATDLAHDA